MFSGLHYRVDLATGLKEAKLMDESDGSEYYAMVERWMKDRRLGKPSTEGGFKVTRSFKKNPFTSGSETNSAVALVEVPRENPSEKDPLAKLTDEKESRLLDEETMQQIKMGHKKKVDAFRDARAEKKAYLDDIEKIDDSHFKHKHSAMEQALMEETEKVHCEKGCNFEENYDDDEDDFDYWLEEALYRDGLRHSLGNAYDIGIGRRRSL